MLDRTMPPDDEEEGQGAAPSFGGMSPSADDTGEDEGGEPAPDDEGAEGEPAPEEDQGGGEEAAAPGRKATPEQQAQYKQFVMQGIHAIYHDHKPDPAILHRLATGDPKQALADASVNLVMTLVTTAKDQGLKLDGAVILKGGQRLFEELADLSAAAHIHKYTQGELDASWVLAMSLAQKHMAAAHLIDPRAFVRDVQEMNKAEAEGRVDDILPGLGKLVSEVQAAKQGGGAQQPAPDDGGDSELPAEDAAPAEQDDEEDQKPRFGGFGKGG